MYITTKREDRSPVNSAANSRMSEFHLKPLVWLARASKRMTRVARHRERAAKTACFIGFFALSGCLTAQRIDDAIIDAWKHDEAMPLATRIDETLTIERAYALQTRIVRKQLRGDAPVGFKAGLTSTAAQSRFNAQGPIAGVLLVPASATPRELPLRSLRGLHLELEVAFRVGKRIDKRLVDVEDLKEHVDGVAPAIELPDLDYETPKALTALDIVASNVAAAYFVTGEFLSPAHRDPNQLTATLVCDGKRANVGAARDAMGDQWGAALWLANTMVDQGWTLEPGHVLLTGALGSAVRARPGTCVGEFGDWGQLTVHIVP